MSGKKKFRCEQCGVVFDEKGFDISCGIEVIVMCPNQCIIGSVYIPDICEVKYAE